MGRKLVSIYWTMKTLQFLILLIKFQIQPALVGPPGTTISNFFSLSCRLLLPLAQI